MLGHRCVLFKQPVILISLQYRYNRRDGVYRRLLNGKRLSEQESFAVEQLVICKGRLVCTFLTIFTSSYCVSHRGSLFQVATPV